MYPLCCIDIRNFLNQFYFFTSSANSSTPNILTPTAAIDLKLRTSLDDLLTNNVCASLTTKLSSQYLGQIVQILINLEHFETACHELERLLLLTSTQHNTPQSSTQLPPLTATTQFSSHKKTAENRIFELVNSKVSDLIETAEYDWTPSTHPILPPQPSNYITTLTNYLSNIMNTVLLSLPPATKSLMLFNAISHTASSILSLPLSPTVTKITTPAITQLTTDIDHLVSYVSTLPNAALLTDSLEELRQSVALMQTDSPDEFYDISLRNKKYRQVDPLKGPVLLEKIVKVDTSALQTQTQQQQQQQQQQQVQSPTGLGIGGDRFREAASTQATRAGERFAGLRERWGGGGGGGIR